MVSARSSKDVFTGEILSPSTKGMNDGEYTWFESLAYYVKKYNLRLPKEFEDKILKIDLIELHFRLNKLKELD